MKNFFISYTHADHAWAQWIAYQLEAAGYSTTIQAWDFVAGSNFVLEMQRAATECERTLAVLSPNYFAARFTQPEWAAALAQDPTGAHGALIPIRVRDFQPDGLFRAIVYIDLVNLDETAARETLLARIQSRVSGQRAKPATAPQFPAPPSAPAPKHFPGTLPAVWNLKPRNPHFTGREAELAQLHDALATTHTAALTQAIHGLGGIGKTQLALEYAHRFAHEYAIVWWVHAETPMTLAADFAALAQPLDLPAKDEREQRIVLDAVRAHLRQSASAARPSLIVFDNANAPDDVRDFLPAGGGHALITSRNPAWRSVTPNPVAVKPLPRAEAIAFLRKRAGLPPPPATGESRGEGELADALGCLPLALTQAAAFIEQSGTSFADYLRMFETHRAELLRDPKFKPHDYPDTVATTWTISFNAVAAESPAAITLMNLCAFFAPDEIPTDWIAGTHAGGMTPPLPDDDYALAQVRIALRKFSLIEATDTTISVHRLVQTMVRDQMDDATRKTFAEAAVKCVDDAFPGDVTTNPESWQVCARLLAHARATTDEAERLHVAPNETARVLNQAAIYLRQRAELSEAKTLFERAITIYELQYGVNHEHVATAVNNLGNVLRALGDLPRAQRCFERALAIDEATFGKDHPNVARDVNNLGGVLRDLGDLPRAQQCFERVIKIFEDNLGANHPNVATAVNNLGMVLRALGDLPRAQLCAERALAIDEATFGTDHPNVARDVNNLGSVLQALGDLPRAQRCFERALKIRQAVFGENHPDVAQSFWWLGVIAQQTGDVENAKKLYARAYQIYRQFLGEEHPTTQNVKRFLDGVG